MLRPRSSAAIPSILHIAQAYRVPLYPVSTGRNWGYGSTCPPGNGGVVLDLSGLNAILEVDAELGTATIEPGVTQGQLRDYLDRHGLPLMVPTTGAGPTTSLVGNALERGYGVTPHGDHFGAVMSLEAVLPNGQIYRPTLSTLGGQRVDRLYKWGVGPYLDGLFAQGNFGVVTQATIALARRPPRVEAFYIFLEGREQLAPAILALRGLLQSIGGLLGGVNVLNGYRLASMTCRYPTDVLHSGIALPTERLHRLLGAQRLGRYLIMGCAYGEPQIIDAAIKTVMRAFTRCSGRRLSLTRRRAEVVKRIADRFPGIARKLGLGQASRMISALNLLEGIPDDIALRLVHWKSAQEAPADLSDAMLHGSRSLLWYAPLVPLVPSDVLAYEDMVTRVCLDHHFEPLITLTTLSDRCFDSSVPILFDRSSKEETSRAYRCYEQLFDEGRRMGLLPYRVGSSFFGKLAAGTDPALDLARALKRQIDPDNVLAPGRYNL